MFKVGDRVIYAKTKTSVRPAPGAGDIRPAASGEAYAYTVLKYWVVSALPDAGTLEIRTRRGKKHLIAADDPLLRRATWLERLFRRGLFPGTTAPEAVLPKRREA